MSLAPTFVFKGICMHTLAQPTGEVLTSSLRECKAIAWDIRIYPPFGSLVTIENGQHTIFALVYHIETGPIDSIRMPTAFKMTEAQLIEQHPEIFPYICTHIHCVHVGYLQDGNPLYQVPPRPPMMHALMYQATVVQQELFFARSDYLHTLFGLLAQQAILDELLLAIVHQQQPVQEALEELLQTYCVLTNNDYKRLKMFLQRLGR